MTSPASPTRKTRLKRMRKSRQHDRQPSQASLRLYATIREHPGISYGELAHMFNVPKCVINIRLSALEHPDTLVCEDAGRMWAMER